MKNKFALILTMTLGVSSLVGCSAVTQNIPVSSNPSGAIVYADGTQTCITPCSVDLETTQAHILTLKKDGYRQADVQISQKYDTGGVTRDAVQSGMSSSSMGSSIEGSIAGALLTAGQEESSGAAYTLSPSSVVVTLVTEGGAAPTATGQVPQATVKTTEPATIGSAIEENPEGVAKDVLKEAAVAAPTVGTEKEMSHHSHTSTHYNNDGSMTTKSSSSSVKVGVHVNPVEAGIGALEFLEGMENSKEKTDETN